MQRSVNGIAIRPTGALPHGNTVPPGRCRLILAVRKSPVGSLAPWRDRRLVTVSGRYRLPTMTVVRAAENYYTVYTRALDAGISAALGHGAAR